jgi:cyclophilin family peptidyl-prolyl cis-trans isomerase
MTLTGIQPNQPSRQPRRAWLVIALLPLAASLPQPAVHAQAVAAVDSNGPASTSPEAASGESVGELEQAAARMREHVKTMRATFIRYQMSGSVAAGKPIRAEWIKLLEKGRLLHREMLEAGLRDYQRAPLNTSDEADFLFNYAARATNRDRFDHTLAAVKALAENGFNEPTFNLCAGLTFAAHNEFELARPYLQGAMQDIDRSMAEIAKSQEMPPDQKKKLIEDVIQVLSLLAELADTPKQVSFWEHEQAMLEADAAGPPLPRVLIKTTKGELEVELFEDQAPNTVANFITLCEQGFYDGLPFHRVLTHFMAQTGCPNGDGSGGPGYSIPGELEHPNRRNFFRGTLGMALSANDPNSGGSQFFICFVPRSHLNGGYVAFGRVVRGMDVLSDIVHIDPDDKSPEKETDPPDEILGTEVLRKRDHAYQPQKIQPGQR